MKNHFLLFAFLFPFFCACSSPAKQNNEGKIPPAKDSATAVMETLPTGQVIDVVPLKSASNESFALYLPKNYDAKKIYPIIYAFDAHATGKLPVLKYKELAEKYGYIIAGSNNSQNGMQWPEAQAIALRLITDTRSRLAIDPQRMYAMGFSGGARVANALTLSNAAIAGVICCGAANPMFQPVDARSNYTFFGIAGTADFNYTEMHKYDLVELAGHNVKHTIITFDGKHEWPDAAVMENAFVWEELDNMRHNLGAKNDAMIQPALKTATEQLKQLLKENKEYEAYQLCRRTINFYENLGDLTFFFDTYKKLKTSTAVDQQMRTEEAMWLKEEKVKGAYMDDLQSQNYDWWQKEVSTINQKIKISKDKDDVNMQKRILNFLSLACYMQTNGLLKQNNIPGANYWDKMYVLIDPTNSEAHYFMAEIKAKQNDTAGAITALNNAVKNGFNDVNRLQNDEAFAAMKGDAKFGEVVKKAGEAK